MNDEKSIICPLGLRECIKQNCRYWNIISDCRYERMQALEKQQAKDERIAEAVENVRISDSPLIGKIR